MYTFRQKKGEISPIIQQIDTQGGGAQRERKIEEKRNKQAREGKQAISSNKERKTLEP